jgi:hypothetical protein
MPSLEIILNTAFTAILIFYWIMAFIIFYHLVRFGIGVQPKRYAIIFLLGSLILTVAIFIIFSRVDFIALMTT